jgi:putative transcriptional regulator
LCDVSDPAVVGRAVRRAAATVSVDGQLLVYYAGHGLIDPEDGTLILALPDCEPEVPHEAGLPYEWIRRATSASAALRRIVILDCCYAGRATSEMAAQTTATDAVADRAEIDETCLLVSAPANRPAAAPEGARYTAFTGELLRVLRTGLPGGAPVLTVEMVWREIRRALLAKDHERPELRERNSGGSIPLVRNAATQHRDLVGSILVAGPSVTDADLRRAAVLILRHNETGAAGVRLTGPMEPLPRELSAEWRALLGEPAVVFNGGPVARDGFIALALLRPNTAAPLRFTPLRERLGTVSLSAQPETLRNVLTSVRIFSGYLGWGPGELEAYLDSGVLVPTNHHSFRSVSSSRPEELWLPRQNNHH